MQATIKDKKADNSLWKHSQLYHEEGLMEWDLKITMIEGHRNPLERQIHEGVQLEIHKADLLMNSKSEWNGSKIPRIVIETGDDLEEDELSGMSGKGSGREQNKASTKKNEVGRRRQELGIVVDEVEKRKERADLADQGEPQKKKVRQTKQEATKKNISKESLEQRKRAARKRWEKKKEPVSKTYSNEERSTTLEKWLTTYRLKLREVLGVVRHLERMGIGEKKEENEVLSVRNCKKK